MSSHSKLPRWAKIGRAQWAHTGARRPAFAEKPRTGQESVWDYPRPPRLVGDDRRVVVRLGNTILADSRRTARVLETSHPPSFYIPQEDVLERYLTRARSGSRCEWKGEATYWDLAAEGRCVPSGAWSYDRPFGEFVAIAGHLSFYPAHFQCTADGASVTAQPGGFYGGWITPELVGPFKGAPGSGSW